MVIKRTLIFIILLFVTNFNWLFGVTLQNRETIYLIKDSKWMELFVKDNTRLVISIKPNGNNKDQTIWFVTEYKSKDLPYIIDLLMSDRFMIVISNNNNAVLYKYTTNKLIEIAQGKIE